VSIKLWNVDVSLVTTTIADDQQKIIDLSDNLCVGSEKGDDKIILFLLKLLEKRNWSLILI